MKEENTQPILSISFLCSGRNIEEARKCLDSLMTIRTRLSSEIIIVDTGCGSEARALIEKYADEIVDFTWCNDFAKARNAGLEKCTGEWFMFIDDDEWFENTDELVDFFNSDNNKNYDQVGYIIRNYSDFEGTKYEDIWSNRIVKNVDDLKFVGRIHEYLEPVGSRVKRIPSMVHHYGYVYKNTEGLFRKAQRNIPLLLDMIKEEPDNGHWRAQLIQEYRNTKDYSSMERLSLSSLDKMSDIDNPMTNVLLPDFYEGVLIAEINTFEYTEASDHVESFLNDKRNSEKCNIGLCYYAAQAYWKKKDYRNAFIYSQKYLEGYDKYSLIEDVSVDDLTFMCGNLFDDYRVQYSIAIVINAGARCGNISSLHDYFGRFDLTAESEPVLSFTQGVSYAFENYDFDERFVKYVERMSQNKLMFALLIKEAARVEEESQKCFIKLIELFGRTDIVSDVYILYMRILYEYRHQNTDNLIKLYSFYFYYVADFLDMNEKLWQIAQEKKVNLISLFKDVPYNHWKGGVDRFFYENIDKNPEKIHGVSKIIKDDSDIRFNYFHLKEKEMSVIQADRGVADSLLFDYCSSCVDYYLQIYRAEIFTGDTTILPDECRFAMEFVKTVNSEKKFSPVDYIHELEKCASIYAPFANAMKSYIAKTGERKKKELLQSL